MKLSKEDKRQIVDRLSQRIDESQVVGILDMHSLPARQLQQLKKEMKDEADITMARKSLMELAIDQSDKENIEDLKDNTAIQPAFIFSDSNPFGLYSTIKENKSSAAASGGEIAPSDIVIDEGDTGLGPGPMIGKLQQLGAQTSVQDGSIHVQNSAVAVEEGEEITPEVADILNQLDMKPLEVGLDLKLVHEKGELFDKSVLDIDQDRYRQDIEAAASRAFNLAVNAAVPDEAVIESIIAKAAGEAEALDEELDLEQDDDDEEAAEDSASQDDTSDEADDGADEEADGNTDEQDDANDTTETSEESDSEEEPTE
jgi:large subunit ribosomal protein L10